MISVLLEQFSYIFSFRGYYIISAPFSSDHFQFILLDYNWHLYVQVCIFFYVVMCHFGVCANFSSNRYQQGIQHTFVCMCWIQQLILWFRKIRHFHYHLPVCVVFCDEISLYSINIFYLIGKGREKCEFKKNCLHLFQCSFVGVGVWVSFGCCCCCCLVLSPKTSIVNIFLLLFAHKIKSFLYEMCHSVSTN